LNLRLISHRARRRGRQNGFRRNRNRGKASALASAMPDICACQNADPRLPAPRMQLIGVNIVPPRDLGPDASGTLPWRTPPNRANAERKC